MRYFLLFLCSWISCVGASAETRIKDLTSVQGIRGNHLVGYGLVLGLNGTGDSLRNAPFTQQSMQSMLDRMGVNIRGAQARTRNIAAVMVMAELPAFSVAGARIDVTVASLGDATSLSGGSLIMTPLSGADEVIYAVAQGAVTVSGGAAGGRNETVTRGVPTSARIPNGAMVERDAPVRRRTAIDFGASQP
jgi:flagellar P-ring protein FlgI